MGELLRYVPPRSFCCKNGYSQLYLLCPKYFFAIRIRSSTAVRCPAADIDKLEEQGLLHSQHGAYNSGTLHG